MTITPNAAPAFLRLHELDKDVLSLYAQARKQLANVERVNRDRIALYEGSNTVRHLDIAVPPGPLQDLKIVAGWAGTAIDVLGETVSWTGWTSTGELRGLDEVFDDNYLDDETDKAITDALIAGVGFISVGTGNPDNNEPQILVTAESPVDCTVVWDHRSRRAIAGLSRTVDDRGIIVMESLHILGETIVLDRRDGNLVVAHRDPHGRQRIPITRLPNKGRSSRAWGRSELTPAVGYFNDAAVRTLLGMEINREFYTTPQRWIMGADMSMFTDEHGNTISAWESIAGHMLAAPVPEYEDENGDVARGQAPTVGQFTPAPPTPYIDQIRHYSMEMARELGIPANYLGYATENPASADAIRAGQQRLTQRSRRRIRSFTRGLHEVAYNALLWRDGAVDHDWFRTVSETWVDPSPQTPEAAADEAVKLIGAGVLVPESRVTYEKVGLTPAQIKQIETDKRRARGANRAGVIAAGQEAAAGNQRVARLVTRTETPDASASGQ